MAGRRLLDAALVLNAARTVARQHFRIRGEQLDTWTKTSSIAKAVKNQTDRVTLTVGAARALARRLNEDDPPRSEVYTSSRDDSIPREQTAGHTGSKEASPQGLEQDHHYERSEQNAAQQPVPQQSQTVTQKTPEHGTLPDGTISPLAAESAESAEPRAEQLESDPRRDPAPAVEPLAGQQTERVAPGIKPATSSETTLDGSRDASGSSIPEQGAIPEQESIPEGINTDVFHSPKVAQLLGGARKRNPFAEELKLRKAKETPVDKSAAQRGIDQETFGVRESIGDPDAGESKVKFETINSSSGATADAEMSELASEIAKDASTQSGYQMKESRVPSSRFGRIWEYAGLGTSMAFGAVNESLRRVVGAGSGGSLLLSPANMERLVAKLSKMRGAALKLGQMMSLQDSRMLPGPIANVLQRVQDNADYMPPWQRDQVLSANLGAEWRSLFAEFHDVPIAAASIGQVHRATLASTNTPVAVKIQYPGVATSISSDLNNLSVLLNASRLLPKGLFLDKTIANARLELSWECDYEREARYQDQFYQLLRDEQDTFTVPKIFKEACGPQVLTAEFMSGTAVTKSALNLSQKERDWIGTNILRLCLRELTELKLMQTDPNWTNFLYNRSTKKLELLDFGAAREFPDKFVEPYVRTLIAASKGDREQVHQLSIQLGYLTGAESATMINAHIDTILTLSEPFTAKNPVDHVYDFRDQTVTDRVRALIPVMIRERLSPPPEETYSLHRKLSGAFLLLAKLGSRVECRRMFVDATKKWDQPV